MEIKQIRTVLKTLDILVQLLFYECLQYLLILS